MPKSSFTCREPLPSLDQYAVIMQEHTCVYEQRMSWTSNQSHQPTSDTTWDENFRAKITYKPDVNTPDT